MSQGTLYVKDTGRSDLQLAIIEKHGLDIEIIKEADIDERYKANFPLRQFPCFIGPKGLKLQETLAIASYLINLIEDEKVKAQLLGSNVEEQSLVWNWQCLNNGDLLMPAVAVLLSNLGIIPYNKKTVEMNTLRFNRAAELYEQRLTEFTYLATENLSVADLLGAKAFGFVFTKIFGQAWRDAHPAIMRWYNTVVASDYLKNQPVGDFLKEDAAFVAPKKEQSKKEKPKQEQPKKEQPKKEPSEENETVAVEKKPKHPLAALPPSTFILDEWKRKYSNEDTRPVALPWFWENYNPEEYSIWKVGYKYNDELTLTFMSNNLIGGFFNRLSASTKYIFGCLVVYGENNNNGIIGAIMVRGQDYAPAFDVAPDWESYEYTKLDPSKEEDKEFVNDMWAWDKPVIVNGEPREIADGKVLK